MRAKPFEPEDVSAWIALTQIQGLGHTKIYQLLKTFGSPNKVFSANTHQLKEVVSESIAKKSSKASTQKLPKKHFHG